MKMYAAAEKECNFLRTVHRALQSTWCPPTFCHLGCMTRITESRIGREQPLVELQQNAVDFLRECRDRDTIQTDQALNERTKEAFHHIFAPAVGSTKTDVNGQASRRLGEGPWYKRSKGLEYGLRASWRNASRCTLPSESSSMRSKTGPVQQRNGAYSYDCK